MEYTKITVGGPKVITPSDKVNRLLWRYARGLEPWSEVDHAVRMEITAGRFNPETDIEAIHAAMIHTYFPEA